ncbi:MAG: hypothetical protein ABIE22_01280 [archaeon]
MVQRPEIVQGLKNSIDRGFTIAQSKQSFINSGYSKQDVEDSAALLGYGVTSSSPPPQTPRQPIPQQRPAPQQSYPNSQGNPIQKKPMQPQYRSDPPALTQIQQTRPPTARFQPLPNPQKQSFMPEQKKSKKGLVFIIILSVVLTLLLFLLIMTVAVPETVASWLQAIGIDISL